MPEAPVNSNLRSEQVQEILTAIPNWMIRWGNTLVFFLLILLLAISWWVKYPDVISSEVMLTTTIPPQKVYARSSGKIDSILVLNGQAVNTNTPLAILENTAKFTDVFYLKNILENLKLREEAFYVPMEQLPFFILGELESSFALFENSYEQYVLNRELKPFSNETFANQNTLLELQNRLRNLELQQALDTKAMALEKTDLVRHKALFAEGLISKQVYEQKQMDSIRAAINYQNIHQSISQVKESINQASLTTKTISINRTKEEKQLWRQLIQSVMQLKEAIKVWESKYVLSSQINGKVSFLAVWTESQNVNTGDWVFTILPTTHDAYLAKLKTPVQNSGKMELGQTVKISLANYPETEFGNLNGKVNHISAIASEDGFYTVDVVLPKKLITTYQKEIEFKPEMRGTAKIITEDLRLIERFFYQFKSIFHP
ncbi:MAG: HlyD family secretion protein [Saprospiraceae bacterium]